MTASPEIPAGVEGSAAVITAFAIGLPAARRTAKSRSIPFRLAFGCAGNQRIAFVDLSIKNLNQGRGGMIGDACTDLHRFQLLGWKHLPDNRNVGGSGLAPLLLGLSASIGSLVA